MFYVAKQKNKRNGNKCSESMKGKMSHTADRLSYSEELIWLPEVQTYNFKIA